MSDVGVKVDYGGLEEGAEVLARLQDNLRRVDSAQQQATRSSDSLGESAQELGGHVGSTAEAANGAHQKFGAVQGILGQLGPAVGRVSPAFAGLSSSIAQTASSALSMTESMGPAGLAIAGITLVATAVADAMSDAASEADLLANAFDRQARSAVALTRNIRSLAEAQAARRQEEIERFQQDDVDREARARSEIRAIESQIESTRRLRNEEILTQVQYEARMRTLRQAAEDARAELAFARRGGDPAEQERLQAELQEQIRAAQRQAAEDAARRRGGHRRTFAQDEGAAWQRAEERHRIYQEALIEGLAEQEARQRQLAQIDEQLHQNRMDRLEREQESIAEHYAQIRELEEEVRDKQKEAARARMVEQRGLLQDAQSTAAQIGSAYFQAFEMAIEGTMSLEDALLAATKQILKSIGEELVARGIGKVLEGIAEIPSPTAATKIAGGTAMVGFGIGLGAAGAAIPAPKAEAAEQPREQPDSQGDRGPKEITVVFGNPVLTAGTQTQLARGMGRAIAGDRTFPTSLAA